MGLFFLCTVCFSMAQQTNKITRMTVLCYNVENLFDTIDDPRTDDNDFLPNGANHWTVHRYQRKLERIAQVVSHAGEYRWPALVGLVEVENEQTIQDLIQRTSLRRMGYHYLVTSSADPRGIDVALLYRPDLFSLDDWQEYNVRFENEPEKHSRHVLFAHGAIGGVPLSLMLCHMPSRRGGVRKTEKYRRAVATRMRQLCDSLHQSEPERHILIMGDFNGLPEEAASSIDLGAKLELPMMYLQERTNTLTLYNLSAQTPEFTPPGSYYYRGGWEQIDQFIASESLLTETSSLRYVLGSARSYAPYYLGHKPKCAGYLVPWRTYVGRHYLGGYSDHYPIVLVLERFES